MFLCLKVFSQCNDVMNAYDAIWLRHTWIICPRNFEPTAAWTNSCI